MLVTDLAYRDMEVRSDSLFKRLGNGLGALFRRSPPNPRPHDGIFTFLPEHAAHLQLLPPATGEAPRDHDPHVSPGSDFRWRRHPQLLKHHEANNADQSDVQRGARSSAVRGLFLARSGRFRDARTAFAVAASEPAIDLTAIPGFWDLPRTGMMAAVHAYEDARRFRDASALNARIRLTYRPRSISALPEAPAQESSAAGS